jgi:hypothetical protein
MPLLLHTIVGLFFLVRITKEICIWGFEGMSLVLGRLVVETNGVNTKKGV